MAMDHPRGLISFDKLVLLIFSSAFVIIYEIIFSVTVLAYRLSLTAYILL